MEVGVLYSGGKDSTLAALLLDPLCEVTLLCCTFGLTDDFEHAREAADVVGFPAQVVELDRSVAHEAAGRIVADGFPRNGIQRVHEHALEVAAALGYDAVADGTRRDDRVPTVDRPLAQSLEDRHDIAHLAPLAGTGRTAVDALVAGSLVVETGPSETVPKGDYETELRALVAAEHGRETVEEVFPEHTQSRVVGRA
ncbi:MAG: putative PP-loop ATPase [halophilic archaeon J07HX64]|jgi:Predicted subunit of tRNA(5-methylaminomethyl-2-thiouridylate) methyltransferase, contains the PP-loop ATPase domain|nr:MAG: putative PP-loop ATPase [halophilic archaeon J07HX64]